MNQAECIQVFSRLSKLQLHGTPTTPSHQDAVLAEWGRTLQPIRCDVEGLANRLVESCERWPSIKAVRDNAYAVPSRHLRSVPGTYSCRCGEGRGWVTVDAASDIVGPCPDCRPETYARWSGGHYAPDAMPSQDSEPQPIERRS